MTDLITTDLDPVPSRSAPSTFSSRTDTLLGKLPVWTDEANALATGANTNKLASEAAQTAAETAETNAETAETGANTAWEHANKWAVEDENVPVTDGVNPSGYSAYHWAQKANSGSSLYATSSTSNTITDTGSITFTLNETFRAFAAGTEIKISQTSDPVSNYMLGIVTSYNNSTDELVVTISESGGAGTISDWSISLRSSGSADTIPAGGIMMWSGAIANIPGGWALCDGTNGTPNLQNKFILGAGDTYAVDATGGSADHSHADNFSIPAHAHGDTFSIPAHAHSDTFSVASHTHTNTLAVPIHGHSDTFTVADHTLTEAQLASHGHPVGKDLANPGASGGLTPGTGETTGTAGSDSAHGHTISGSVTDAASISLSGDIASATPSITGSVSSQNISLSGSVSSATITLSGDVSSETTLPPYYALAYIMKL